MLRPDLFPADVLLTERTLTDLTLTDPALTGPALTNLDLEPAVHPFFGRHLLAELYGVCGTRLDDPELLAGALRQGVTQSGATLLNLEVKRFDPQGVTILALLAESHASLHTYPEVGALFFDAFTCGLCDPEAILAAVVAALEPAEVERRLLKRGGPR